MRSILSFTFLYMLMAGQMLSCKSDSKISGTVKEGRLSPSSSSDSDKGNTVSGSSSDPSNINNAILNGEAVSVPSAVTGAFLVCALEESNEKVEVKVGCGFQDANNKPVAIRSIAAADRFYLVGEPPAGVTVTVLPADATYDAIFSFTGPGFDALKVAAFNAVYQVELTGLANGEASKIIGGTGTQIATPPAARWTREVSTDLNGNGLCESNETCIYQGNGLMWFRDLGEAKDYASASSFCDGFTDTYSDWRLPNEAELKMAFEKGIVEIAGSEILNLANEGYWALAADATTGVNPISGQTISFPAGEIHRSLCVRSFAVP